MASRKGVRPQKQPKQQEQQVVRSMGAASAVEEEVGKSIDRSKKATSRIFLILRIILFALACVFAIMGVRGFIEASNTQTVSRVVTTDSVNGEPVRNAIVIFSSDDSDASVSYERSGVLNVLNRSGISSDVYYLDTSTGTSAAAIDKGLYEFIRDKASSGMSCDAVVVSGDEALSFVANHRDLFGGLPTVFFSVEGTSLAGEVKDKGYATGFLEKGGPSLILTNAEKLLPAYKKVIVLVDGSASSKGLLDQLEADKSAAPSFEREVWDVSKMTRDELADKVANLGSDEFIMLLSANRDSAGNGYTSTETAYFLAGLTRKPIFSAFGGVGEGVCGSAFFDRETEGANSAKLLIDMLNGADVSSLAVTELQPEACVFDVQQLMLRGMNPDLTPEDSALINESSFSWRVLRPFVQPTLFLLGAVACIVGFGVIGFRRSIRSNRAIIASRDELQYRLYHDVLTNLPNRIALEQYLVDPKSGDAVRSVVRIHADNLSDINDAYGHSFGDEVIKIVAKRLENAKAALIARTAEDEFTLLLNERLKPESSVLSHLERIFADPIIIGDNKVEAAATIGIANREKGMSGADLIVAGDLATNFASDENLHQPVFYTDDMLKDMERRLEITEYLKQAIAEERVVVLWQPQVDTENLTVYGYEALCRLEGNKYFPNDFIPVAEMSGLVNPLDRVVTKKVIEQLGVWLKEGRKDVGVASINFSAAQLRDKGYCDFLAEQLAKNKVPASLLKIEITESMILGNEEEADKLFARLRSMGITLALDDFGTGYSSLYRMANRPVDFVKLDKSLVDTFMVPGKEGFIDDVTRLIHGLGKTIVVEGVETYEQYQMCLNFGCDIIQGYFFARPMPAEEAISLDPNTIIAEARAKFGDKTRNGNWSKYDRDEHGRWKKKPKE